MNSQLLPEAQAAFQAGLVCLQAGNINEAESRFRDAIRMDGRLAAAHYQLGNCLRRGGMEDRAERALKEAIRLDPDLHEAYHSLAFLYQQAGRGEEAGPPLVALSERAPRDALLQRQVAGLLEECGCYAEAVVVNERLVGLEPNNPRHYVRLAQHYQKLGRYQDAERICNQLIHTHADAGAAYHVLAHTRKMKSEDKSLAAHYEQVLIKPGLSEETRLCLHFGLGKIYDDLGAYDAAFGHFKSGNDLRHAAVNFEHTNWKTFINRLKSVFTDTTLQNPANTADTHGEPMPIFIVGMPRSGTTLVERILASHPAVLGIGEKELLDQLSALLSESLGSEYPECALRVPADQWQEIAHQYRRQWPKAAQAYLAVVDKNPLNFLHLGLITRLFPNARIVHCTRDPLDTCLSVYFQNFAHPRNSYAYNLEDIAFFYNCYRELMTHWKANLPLAIHELNYESLATDAETQIRDLIRTLGLEWNDNCLQPQNHPSSISTASAWQARQPIYKDSIGHARHYLKHLGNLKAALQY